MAIGSEPAIGEHFKSCRDYTKKDWDDWFAFVRKEWHPWLHNGWATLIHDKSNNPFYKEDDRG